MSELRSHKSASGFLDDAAAYLGENELGNNLMLGICNALSAGNALDKDHHFVTVNRRGRIRAASIKTWVKAIVSGSDGNTADMKLLSDYYKEHNIALSGVFGESFYAESFASFHFPEAGSVKRVLSHKLVKVIPGKVPEGKFKAAESRDLDLLHKYFCEYEEEVHSVPKRNPDELRRQMQGLIAAGDMFVWALGDVIVGMAAVVRRTKNMGIVGYVYTPRSCRGKGYAGACVEMLSRKLLDDGYKACGLFTDKDNPTSNGIYKRIGYEQEGEFSDVVVVV